MILFDTNVLVYAHNSASPYHKKAFSLEKEVMEEKFLAAISTQNLLEFYATVTSPSKVPNPLKPAEARLIIKDYLDSPFKIIHPILSDIKQASWMAEEKAIAGRRIFDIYLVSTMISNGIDTIYTGNEKHFKMFGKIKAINPFIQ